jgi:hypothetical protein
MFSKGRNVVLNRSYPVGNSFGPIREVQPVARKASERGQLWSGVNTQGLESAPTAFYLQGDSPAKERVQNCR